MEENQTFDSPTLGLPNVRGFKIAALNIASLPGHIKELKTYMAVRPIDILAVNETRLDDSVSSSKMSIPGYCLERNDRNRHGGGVALYIRDTINYECLLNHDSHINLEWIAVKVTKRNAKPFIVGKWYRPPGCGIEILNAFVTLLHHLETHDLETNIIGDFNYDISGNPQNHQTKNFLELCNLYQYSQLIQVPTRVTASSSTLIYLFLTNDPCKFSHHGVSHIGISDHCLIYAIRKSFISTGYSTIINSRQLKNFDPTMFRRDLALAPWQSVENTTAPNVAWNAWRNMFLNICDSHAPFRRKKVRSSNSPWLTPDLKKLMFERDKAKKLTSMAGSSETWMP